MSFRNISIIGLGLMGGSVALALKQRVSTSRITGYDIYPTAIQQALSAGAIDHAAGSLQHACESADCIILSVPLGQALSTLSEILPFLSAGVCITDVSSTKETIVETAQRLLPATVHFVGSHPMAGSELSGFSAARSNLFDDANCLTTPVPGTDAAALESVEAMWQSLGATIKRLSPAGHDELVAQISHLPHLLASALVNAVTDDSLSIAGPGFRDLTRIAAGDGTLWRDILLDNAGEVRQCLKRLRQELDRADAMLEQGRGDELKAWLTAAARRRHSAGKIPSA